MPSLETKDAQLFVSAVEAAEILGIARRSLISRVEAGTVQAAHKLPGRTGAFLFDRAYIEQIAADEREASQRRSALAAAPEAPEDYAMGVTRSDLVTSPRSVGGDPGGAAEASSIRRGL